MKSYDKDRTDEQLHKYIHVKNKNKISFVDTNVGGDLNVMKNLTTDTLKANRIGYDLSGFDASGYSQFLDVSTNSLKVYGDALVTGTLEINNILRKTMTDIDITGDLDLNNKLDVSGLFTTHGGFNLTGVDPNDKINNATIGYDVSGRGAFTDLSCSVLNAGSILLTTLDNCIIGSNNPSDGAFLDLSSHIMKVGDTNSSGTVISNGNQNLELKTGSSNTGSIIINQGEDSNINIYPNGTGTVNIPKVDINLGLIKNVDMSSSNVFISTSKILDVSSGTLITSIEQKSEIFRNGALNNTSDIDIQNYGFRANSLTADSLPEKRIIFTGTDGLLTTKSGLEYDSITDTLSVQKLGPFTATGAIDLNNQYLTNVDINNGTIDNTTIRTSDIIVGVGKNIDVQYSTFTTSITQDVNSFHRAILNNNTDLDIQAYSFRAANITADALTPGRIVFTGTEGLLSVEPEFLYDQSVNKLTVQRMSGFECTGNINFNDMSAINADIYGSNIIHSDISNCDINIPEGKKINISNGTLTTSNSQDVSIFQNGASNNNANIDIQNYNFRASTLTADSISSGQVLYTGDDGILTGEPGFEYNTTANTMTVQNITCSGVFSLSQSINNVTASSPSSQIDISYTKTALITTSTDFSFTLPDSAEGHTILIFLKTKGGASSATISPTNFINGTSIELTSIGSNALLIFTDNKWMILSSFGSTII